MLRLLCITILLALAKCDSEELELENFVGQWTAVKVYPDIQLLRDCEILTLELTNDHCKCGKNKSIPVFTIRNAAGATLKVPVIPMDTEEDDVEQAFSQKCRCKNKMIDTDMRFVFRYMSENYFLIYTSMAGPNMAILVAKELPTEKELNEFEHNSTVLSDEEGATVCTAEMKTRNISNKLAGNNNTTATHWLHYRPSTTTTEPTN